ncbi:MAG: type II toxin-antitoxin system mRNA interferase toxin, RelE/StbE family [Kiritimatiellae bacterium]|jgi:addiction module RelE/StbE family toxin|nr:type II toxin-antitoxin system mRNA interferase toxin, RelE/StbE family [Kiritimatiellia bacterium]MDD4342392.1 type II toxin-antitoxin system mRNA interferase toxin, RelE/StbE family [Kiritimatiellia bacterium]
MRTLVWSHPFKRAFRRMAERRPDLQKDLEEAVAMLIENPFNPKLKAHKLKGKLAGTWACSAGYDVRIIFEFVKDEGSEDAVFLIELGTHDEVY